VLGSGGVGKSALVPDKLSCPRTILGFFRDGHY
jgi:hypothetical protein